MHYVVGMLATLRTAAIFGVDAVLVKVEVDVTHGIPGYTVVGLPDRSVVESRDRVRSAIRNSGFAYPPDRVTVNLGPADLHKKGGWFDLPIALGVIAAAGHLNTRQVEDVLLLGELSLDGSIQPARGVLPAAVAAARHGVRRVLLSPGNAAEAVVVKDLQVVPVQSLREAVEAIEHPDSVSPLVPRAGSIAVSGAQLPMRSIWPTFAVRRWRGGRWRLRRRDGITCCSSARRGVARRCWRGGCRASCRACRSRRRWRSRRFIRWRDSSRLAWASWASGRFARRITPYRASRWSAAARRRGRAKSASRIMACCSSTNCPSSAGVRSRCCASRSRRATS